MVIGGLFRLNLPLFFSNCQIFNCKNTSLQDTMTAFAPGGKGGGGYISIGLSSLNEQTLH